MRIAILYIIKPPWIFCQRPQIFYTHGSISKELNFVKALHIYFICLRPKKKIILSRMSQI